MKASTTRTGWPKGLCRYLLLNAVLVISGAGCATHDERSYNQDFGQSLPAAPKYVLENIDESHFKLVLHQGLPDNGPGRVTDMKNAAPVIAETEAKSRGWPNWQLDYIQEKDQGWMHVLIAEVTRKNPAEKLPDRSSGN
ncbi:MAG: hypothetical protein ABSE48_21495 [Verrucomicrobiota bacterium]|jgi:hypothetical protein